MKTLHQLISIRAIAVLFIVPVKYSTSKNYHKLLFLNDLKVEGGGFKPSFYRPSFHPAFPVFAPVCRANGRSWQSFLFFA